MTEIHQRDEPADSIATPQEVLETFTILLRTSAKPAEQLKAAESLAKHYGLLSPREDSPAQGENAVAAIEEVMHALEADYAAHP